MIHYNSYRKILTARFGAPVHKLPINGGFSCPNRDGSKSTTGCLFCDNRSFSPAAERLTISPVNQLLDYAQKPHLAGKLLLPYLQPFSNTYAPAHALAAVYEPLLSVPNVVGLAIGTRPDCFTDDVFSYLEQLNKKTYLSIELGLQSSHDATLHACNRGHTFADFTATVNRLTACGIETVAHVMLGLPGETPEMMRQTAVALAKLPVRGVKIHQLMMIRETEFEKLYKEGALPVLTVETYAVLLADFLAHLRPDQEIHRIVADATVENGLVAPLWSADKQGTLNSIHVMMDLWETVQGSACGK